MDILSGNTNRKALVPLLFILLCFIWGSSFMLMKLGMYRLEDHVPLLTPWQLASVRMGTAALFFLPWGIRSITIWRSHPNRNFIWIAGIIGSFVPAILFCLAETRITSALAGMLNATTPLFTIIIGAVLFGVNPGRMQVVGILTGLVGCVMLFGSQLNLSPKEGYYGLLILLATICYGLNVNIARHKLADLPVFTLTVLSMSFLVLPSLLLALFSGLFDVSIMSEGMPLALAAGTILGMLGTAVATVIFYGLVKMAGAVTASMVTYGIPLVAMVWGLVLGETITIWQMAALVVILLGVFLASRKK